MTGVQTCALPILDVRDHEVLAPVIQGKNLVVADIQGVIHWLSVEDGSFRARASSGSRVSAAPLVSGNLLLVQTDKGVIEAWRTPGS